MLPRLACIAGPLKGVYFPLLEESTSVGREASNSICINDASVSRRHCVVRKESDRFKICDLESRNGTFVNGIPIQERYLDEGDQIGIVDSLFVFLLREGDPVKPTEPATQEGDELITLTPTRLRWNDVFYLDPGRILARLAPQEEMARNLTTLLKFSTEINSIRTLEALQSVFLTRILEVIPAERAAILLGIDDQGNSASTLAWARTAGATIEMKISRTILRQICREGAALLVSGDKSEGRLQFSESLRGAPIQAILCVPLVVLGKVEGAVYLDSRNPGTCLNEEHLQLAAAMAGIAAVALSNVRHMESLESENRRLLSDIDLDHSMVGESQPMRQLLKLISKVSPTDATVLIRGESGTGKELVARAIHQNSRRRESPFVAINCAALTEPLLESELFGHERGAFTGATSLKKGKLEVAEGGTVFLDEMGELPPELQVKLLRVLQEREFDRVGGTRSIKIDVRIVAATNRDLEQAIESGGFRRDLYYRLNVVSITLPPLRERRDDIPLLANYFAQRYSRKCGRRVVGIAPAARACLLRYDWPGNVRELANAIERAAVLGSSETILPEDLPETILMAGPDDQTTTPQYHTAVRETKKQLIVRAVQQAGGNYTEAARLLGVHPNYLHRLMRTMNLKGTIRSN